MFLDFIIKKFDFDELFVLVFLLYLSLGFVMIDKVSNCLLACVL